jgi:hypothetical protein
MQECCADEGRDNRGDPKRQAMFAIRANIKLSAFKYKPRFRGAQQPHRASSMNVSKTVLRQARSFKPTWNISNDFWKPIAPKCPACRHLSQSARRAKAEPADDPNFMSIVDNPPNLVRAGRRHGPGLIVLGIPLCCGPATTWLT